MSSSRSHHSGIIDGRELSAYERWELPAMGEERVTVEEVESIQPLTAEQLEQIRAEASEEGFEQGRHEGLQAARGEIDAALMRLEQIIQFLEAPLQQVDEEVEGELQLLALAIARQVVRQEISTDQEKILRVVHDAISLLPSAAREIKLVLHPDDALLLREREPPAETVERKWQLIEDDSLTRGGCLVESESSRIDATMERRINTIAEELFGRDWGSRDEEN
ncbi:MAG: flagellar assembly protein FliH [Chromatiales bacterium]|nr:flagellar assembly protein FliH [Chromatiales bacterium]